MAEEMGNLCEGRVVIITGAARGIGREHALAFARQGAKVVVNDLETTVNGSQSDAKQVEEVVERIRQMGGQAIFNQADVSDWDSSKAMIQSAIDTYGRLDILVNNAGFVRDRMLVNTTAEEWDSVVRVHLRGHFCPTRHAVSYWRSQSKAGHKIDARIINTTSGAGLLGSVGQAAYSAAKAGIASLTLVEAAELKRYNITANAIAPAARTRMTETTFPKLMQKPKRGFDAMNPANISPLVVWLGSKQSKGVTGRVFEVQGGSISIANGWQHGPEITQKEKWNPRDLGASLQPLFEQSPPNLQVYGAQ